MRINLLAGITLIKDFLGEFLLPGEACRSILNIDSGMWQKKQQKEKKKRFRWDEANLKLNKILKNAIISLKLLMRPVYCRILQTSYEQFVVPAAQKYYQAQMFCKKRQNLQLTT